MLSKKILASTLIYGKVPFETALDELKKRGFEIIEMVSEPDLCPHFELVNMTDDDIEAVARKLEQRGLKVKTLNIGDSMLRPTPLEIIRERHISTLRLAKRLGVKQVVFAAGNITDDSEREAKEKEMYAYFLDLAKRAKEYDVTILIEAPHKLGITETPEQVDKFWAAMDSDIKVNFDGAHCIYGGGDPLKMAGKYSDRIWNIHLRDASSGNTYVPFGTGLMPFQELFDLMNEKGYQGTYTLEFLAKDLTEANAILDGAMEFFSTFRV